VEVDVRELGGSKVTVHVSLDASEVKSAFDRTYQRLSDRGGIKGFRPGKVPRTIVDRYYDADGIRAITYEALIEDRLEAALSDHKLRPIDQISIEQGAPPDEDQALADTIRAGLTQADDAADAETPGEQDAGDEAADEEHECGPDCDHEPELLLVEGEPFEFYTTFTAYPRPTLPDLSALKLRRPVAEVTDEQVDEQIERLRQINAEEVEVERDTIEDGDQVVADVKVVLEDEDTGEVEPTSEEIVIGQRQYLGEIDRQLIGHTPGDIVEAEFVYDDDHPDESLRGKSARIIAEIDSFSGRQLPELTDEFAQSLGDYQSLEELRSSIREQLQAAADERAEEELRSQVLRQILEGTQVELPEEFVESAAARSYEQLGRELQQMGMTAADFAEAGGLSDEELRENQRARALGTLTLHFAMEALGEQLGIEIDEADITAELMRVAEESGGDLQFVQQAAMVQPNFAEEMEERALRRKLIARVIAGAQVEDVPAEEYAAEQDGAEAADGNGTAEPGAVTEPEAVTEPDAVTEAEDAAADQESETP